MSDGVAVSNKLRDDMAVSNKIGNVIPILHKIKLLVQYTDERSFSDAKMALPVPPGLLPTPTAKPK